MASYQLNGISSVMGPRPKRVYALDCETITAYDAHVQKNVSFPIQATMVDENFNIVYSKFICPDNTRYKIVPGTYHQMIHGISEATFRRHGIRLADARDEIMHIINGQIVTGHDLRCDLRALQIEHGDTRDTAWSHFFMQNIPGTGMQPKKLSQLALEHLGLNMRADGIHRADEDAIVSMKLYKMYEKSNVWSK